MASMTTKMTPRTRDRVIASLREQLCDVGIRVLSAAEWYRRRDKTEKTFAAAGVPPLPDDLYGRPGSSDPNPRATDAMMLGVFQ